MRIIRTRREAAGVVIALACCSVTCAFVPPSSSRPTLSTCTVTTRPMLSTTRTPSVSRNASPRLSNRINTTLSMTTNKTQGKRRLGAFMAFLCGWADIALFTRYKTFATMMTGNTLWMMLGLADKRYRDVFYYGSIILSYLVGLSVFRRTDLSLRNRTMPVSAILVTALFCVSEFMFSITQGARWIPMLLLAAGFGIINSAGTEIAGTLTFVITGHMTKLTNLAVNRISEPKSSRKPLTTGEKDAAIENAAVLGGFMGGALWASLSRGILVRSKEFALIGILHGILFMSQDMEAIGGAWWLRKYFCDDVVDDDGSVCDLDDDGDDCGEGTTTITGSNNSTIVGSTVRQ